jgi:AmiR/NasT family two-component response regulator
VARPEHTAGARLPCAELNSQTREERVATNYSPPAVHFAIGILMELHNCDPPQAIAMLTSSAVTAGRTITDVALEIIDEPTSAAVGEQPLGGY